MSDDWSARLKEAIEAGTLGELVEPLAELLRKDVLDPSAPTDASNQKTIRLAALHNFCSFYSRVPEIKDVDKKALIWLVDQQPLFERLALAPGISDFPEQVLQVYTALWRSDRETIALWPDLVAALCVVWDQTETDSSDTPGALPDWAVWLYDYFRTANPRLRFSLSDMPWQLQTYVVDVVISREEAQWLWKRYGQRGEVGSLYFEVPYDTAAFYQGADKRIAGTLYTLDNLQRLGGVCVDQSYFATQIGRSMGVPTVTIIGQGGGGDVSHAWVGFLENKGKQLAWNLRSGRYEEQLYFTGSVNDPQTRERISESETSILSELQKSSPGNRVLATALLRSVDILTHRQQCDVVVRSLILSPGQREAWLKLADLGRDGQLTEAQLDQVKQVVRDFAVKDYADLAFEIFVRMMSRQSNLEQITALDALVPLFKQKRPDLVARARLQQGRLHLALKNTEPALRAFDDVLRNYLYAGTVVLDTMQEVDTLLRELKQQRKLAAVYAHVLGNVPKPQASAWASQSVYCQLARSYVNLLDETGDRTTAAKIRAQISAFETTVSTPAQQRR